MDWWRDLGQELKTSVLKIFVAHIATFKAVVDRAGGFPSHLDRRFYQEPYILEDEIGRILSVHMKFVCFWEAFDIDIGKKFCNAQGYRMVLNKQHVILETLTRKNVD